MNTEKDPISSVLVIPDTAKTCPTENASFQHEVKSVTWAATTQPQRTQPDHLVMLASSALLKASCLPLAQIQKIHWCWPPVGRFRMTTSHQHGDSVWYISFRTTTSHQTVWQLDLVHQIQDDHITSVWQLVLAQHQRAYIPHAVQLAQRFIP